MCVSLLTMNHVHDTHTAQREQRQAPKDKYERPHHLGFLEINEEYTGFFFLREAIKNWLLSGKFISYE